uniref:Chromo domain-containing protein n=1 Tax=viral metagenome TaxID=1070528 RepID=A0A6C0LVD4_9ZZZZ
MIKTQQSYINTHINAYMEEYFKKHGSNAYKFWSTRGKQDLFKYDFKIENILGDRVRKGETEYYIKWDGFSKSENTWEPTTMLIEDGHASEIYLYTQREIIKLIMKDAHRVDTYVLYFNSMSIILCLIFAQRLLVIVISFCIYYYFRLNNTTKLIREKFKVLEKIKSK